MLRALPSTREAWHSSELLLDLGLTTALVGINYCPDENLAVAKGGRMERSELELLI